MGLHAIYFETCVSRFGQLQRVYELLGCGYDDVRMLGVCMPPDELGLAQHWSKSVQSSPNQLNSCETKSGRVVVLSTTLCRCVRT